MVMEEMEVSKKSIEALYGIKKNKVNLTRVKTKTKKWLEVFPNPKPGRDYTVEIEFPEFTCRCPRTGHPDFALITIKYTPGKFCVELKALKYYLNSFRDEGHFHEEVTNLIFKDLMLALAPTSLVVEGNFNVRGGTHPIITVGDTQLFQEV